MPGPAPKHESVRNRRNKTSTAATLRLVHSVEAPPLPVRAEGWQAATETWWRDIWSSPMAPEFEKSDRHGLYLLAVLVDQFWREPSTALAAEIRLQRQCFGLTPIDRRRLQWEIERTDEAQDKGRKRRQAAPPPTSGGSDPRDTLRAL